MLQGRTVKLPVAIAAGKVEDCVLKYPPNGQPSQQRFLNWHCGSSGNCLSKICNTANKHVPLILIMML